jgi:O-antigen ligase
LLFNMDTYNAGLFDGEDSEPESLAVFFNEYILNSIKWLLPAVVLFDGCRSRKEAFLALASILGMFFLLALQVIKHMPLSALTMDAGTLSRVASRILVGSLGYSRVTLSMLLAGASWAMLAVLPLIQRRKHKICIVIAAGLVALGQALTGGRMGYVTFGIIGFILGFLRWRRLLFIFPVILLMALSFMPAVRDRMLMGFGSQTGPMVQKRDSEVITSGRSEVWPRVIASIEKAPWFGYGRRGMVVSGTHFEVSQLNGEADFTHPHNAYLEFLLDNGVIGGLFAFLLYGLFFRIALRLFLDRSDVLFGAVGGVAAALLLGLLVAGIGSQTLYPNHQSVGLWAALGVMLRVFIERARSRLTGESLFGEEESDSPVETSEEFPEPA